jgi:hypothetical protein
MANIVIQKMTNQSSRVKWVAEEKTGLLIFEAFAASTSHIPLRTAGQKRDVIEKNGQGEGIHRQAGFPLPDFLLRSHGPTAAGTPAERLNPGAPGLRLATQTLPLRLSCSLPGSSQALGSKCEVQSSTIKTNTIGR